MKLHPFPLARQTDVVTKVALQAADNEYPARPIAAAGALRLRELRRLGFPEDVINEDIAAFKAKAWEKVY
jgi:uncharacterized protein DUF6074